MEERRIARHVLAELRLYAEYFNSPLRCWEPLLEPFSCRVRHEDCQLRGRGTTLHTDCPLHLNVTSALIDTIMDNLKIVDNLKKESSVAAGGADSSTKQGQSREEVLTFDYATIHQKAGGEPVQFPVSAVRCYLSLS